MHSSKPDQRPIEYTKRKCAQPGASPLTCRSISKYWSYLLEQRVALMLHCYAVGGGFIFACASMDLFTLAEAKVDKAGAKLSCGVTRQKFVFSVSSRPMAPTRPPEGRFSRQGNYTKNWHGVSDTLAPTFIHHFALAVLQNRLAVRYSADFRV